MYKGYDDEEEKNIGDGVTTVSMTGRQWQSSRSTNQREVPGFHLEMSKSNLALGRRFSPNFIPTR